MGYTHYWEQNSKCSDGQWQGFCDDVRTIIKASDVPVQRGYDDDREPKITDQQVVFNGVGDDGHETFWFERHGEGFAFCKTARKPYDEIVLACLVAAMNKGIIHDWSSDGGYKAIDDGRNLYLKFTGGVSNVPTRIESGCVDRREDRRIQRQSNGHRP